MTGDAQAGTNLPSRTAAKVPLLYLTVGLFLPTVTTWVYFVWLGDAPASTQQACYGLGKGMQLLLLIFVIFGWLGADFKQSLGSWRKIPARVWGLGALSGLLIGATIFGTYLWLMLPLGIMDSVREVSQAKLSAFGGESVLGLACVGLFYALFHSGFEELYWRGFMYRGWSQTVSDRCALVLSSLGFMSHHVLLLGKFFGYDSVWTYLCSTGVAIGGVIWGLMYKYTGSLWPTWIGHGLVDAALFLVGYHLVFVFSG